MSISFKANQAQVEPTHDYKRVLVTVEVDDDADVLEEVDIKDAIGHYGEDDLLDTIGKEKAMNYFQLIEEREE